MVMAHSGLLPAVDEDAAGGNAPLETLGPPPAACITYAPACVWSLLATVPQAMVA